MQSNSFWLFGRPSMNYGWLKPETEEKKYRRVILHEFGHALGLVHEHLSPNAGSGDSHRFGLPLALIYRLWRIWRRLQRVEQQVQALIAQLNVSK